ncbi:MAG: TlpA disulfide reductase family protein [Planctomycetota bacterium]
MWVKRQGRVLAIFALTILGTSEVLVGGDDSMSQAASVEKAVAFSRSVDRYFDAAEEYRKSLDLWEKQPGERGPRPVDPAAQFVKQALDLEKEVRGTELGISILAQLYRMASPKPDSKDPRWFGREESLRRIQFYADHDSLTIYLKTVFGILDEPITESVFRNLIANTQHLENRRIAQCYFANWILRCKDARGYRLRRKSELDSGMKPGYEGEADWIADQLDLVMTAERLEQLEAEAIELLRDLAEDERDVSIPSFRRRKNATYVLNLDANAKRTSLRELATAILFRAEHLQVGRPAEELDLELLDGGRWRLSDQRGKVIVIQFSFVGCGPCEQMYPTLASLQEKFGEDVSILTIMVDSEIAITRKKYGEGKMTWNVTFDGSQPKVSKRWTIRGFPTVFLVDKEGRIAATSVPNSQLIEQVGALVEAN